jgi:hypothetical protein
VAQQIPPAAAAAKPAAPAAAAAAPTMPPRGGAKCEPSGSADPRVAVTGSPGEPLEHPCLSVLAPRNCWCFSAPHADLLHVMLYMVCHCRLQPLWV